jgi:hypothetical protein
MNTNVKFSHKLHTIELYVSWINFSGTAGAYHQDAKLYSKMAYFCETRTERSVEVFRVENVPPSPQT